VYHECEEHPGVPAVWRCTGCGAFWCDPCAGPHADGPKLRTCPRCGEVCESTDPRIAATVPHDHPFYERAGKVFTYPVAGRGKYVLAGGAVGLYVVSMVMWLVEHGLPAMVLVGPAAAGLALVYGAAYLLSVVRESAEGGPEPPPWPALIDMYANVVRPAVQFVGVLAFSFSGLIAYRLWNLASPSPVTGAADVAWRVTLLAVGAAYMPMALVAVAVHEKLDAVRPWIVLPAIRKVARAYVVPWAMLLAAGLARSYAPKAGALVPILGPLVGQLVALYFLMAAMHATGLLYFCHARRLDWPSDQ